MPPEEGVEVMPFDQDEEDSIYEAALTMRLDPQQPITNATLETFCYVMRYSGMAISDAALLEKKELVGDSICYIRNKNSKKPRKLLVQVPVPWLVERLRVMPLQRGRYFFCFGSDLLASVTDVWQSRLKKLFNAAAVPEGASHRFRHTFATRLFEAGETLEEVSHWLGQTNTKVTQRYYDQWIQTGVQKSSDKLRRLYADTAPHKAAAPPIPAHNMSRIVACVESQDAELLAHQTVWLALIE